MSCTDELTLQIFLLEFIFQLGVPQSFIYYRDIEINPSFGHLDRNPATIDSMLNLQYASSNYQSARQFPICAVGSVAYALLT